MNWARFLLLGTVLGGSLACSQPPEVVYATSTGRRASVEVIDREPWGLLPGGALIWFEVDHAKFVRAEFGPRLLAMITPLLPLPQGGGFDLNKDVQLMRGGLYASAEGDLAVICSGQFEWAAFDRAASEHPRTARGVEIRRARYAGQETLQAGPYSLAVLSPRTMVFGTELGVRRVLERIEEGRVHRALPSWFEQMVAAEGASFRFGVDLDAQPVPATLRSQVSFFDGLRAARLLGNFEPPGLNIAGTLTYDGPAAAKKAGDLMERQAAALARASLLLSILKVPKPIRRLETRADGKDLRVALELDGRAVDMGLAHLGQLDGALGLQ